MKQNMLKNLIFLFLTLLLFSCDKGEKTGFDRFPEGKLKEQITVEGLTLNDPDLVINTFATEPEIINPTNMSIDHRGRVWVCEAYNYRNDVNNVPYNKKGDRISIFEDTDGDGKSDKKTIFYQGEDVNSALGILVLGNKVIVSCSPNVFVFTDTNGDDKPDTKEVLFKSKGGFQSDHGLHTFVYGPDGKLYFNFGNFGEGLLDKNDKPLKDIYGRTIESTRKPFQEGMALRCDLEGKNFEVLGWNFRNNYELCVDSYGRVWQSDNDDDGKRGNRINFVMPAGNYGYKDEMTGADWRVARTNLEDSVYLQHWHQNDPGVVPNLHQTYAGSPTGIFIYEGNELPQKYKGNLFLADAGTNELNSYSISNAGGGFSLTQAIILDGSTKDKWFRPSDITVAPDGSVFVADWYDSGVGGHFIGDLERGRLYRIKSRGSKLITPQYNFSKVDDCIEALKNPNMSVQYLAHQALLKMAAKAEPQLKKLYDSSESIYKARALWLLAEINTKYLIEALNSNDEKIRATAVRAGKNKIDTKYYFKAAQDPSLEVKVAVASIIYLRDAKDIWLTLARAYIPGDKWYLEALGIAADSHWDDYLEDYLFLKGRNWISDAAARDVIFRSRAQKTPLYLAEIINNEPIEKTAKFFRAFDFQSSKPKNVALLKLLENTKDDKIKILVFKHFDAEEIIQNPIFQKILPKILSNIKSEADFLEIVAKYSIKEQKPRILSIMHSESNHNKQAAAVLIQLFGIDILKEVFREKPYNEQRIISTITKIGTIDNEVVTKGLILIFSNDKLPFNIREAAMLAMVGYQSDTKLWNLMKVNKIDKDLLPAAKIVLSQTYHSDLKVAFEQKYGKLTQKIGPMKAGFLSEKGNVAHGKKLFEMYCTACHVANNVGMDFGPNLSLIGKKLTKESIYNAIIKPSQGISFGYEGFNIVMKDGNTVQAIITSKTNSTYMLKYPGQSSITEMPVSEVKSVKQMESSMMPAFPLKQQEYVDLISYLAELK